MEPSQIEAVKEAKIGCPRKSYLSRLNSVNLSETDSMLNPSGLDLLANIASPKHQRVDSFSNVSLPDEMRISFSESDVSFHLDDVDFSYSPAADVDLSSTNIISVDTNSDLTEDKDLQTIQASISSTSGYKDGLSLKQKVDSSKGDVVLDKLEVEKDGKTSFHNLVPVSQTSQYSFPFENGNQLQIDGRKTGAGDSQTGNQCGQAPQVSTVGSSGEVLDKKHTSPRKASKAKHVMNVTCQVCGDIAAGFYCGAYICEACKKFYMRAYKQDKMKYVCLRDKNCVITKESRVQCQYCRFQKCIKLNMYCPKQGEGDGNKDAAMSEIPCRVCSAPSSGFHFGAITCEGCKGFFRRMAKEREPEKYQCTKQGDCEITMLTRNLCKACRYRQCLNAGMSVEGSRIGRQPNSVKHLISMELKHQVKVEPGSDKLLPGEMECNRQELDVQIKEEPVDFLDSSCDKLDVSPNFQHFDNLVNSSLQNSGDIILTSITKPESASLTIPAQIINDSTFNTSESETNNSVLFSSGKKQVTKKFLSLESSEKENMNLPVTVANYTPLLNNLNYATGLNSTRTDQRGEQVPPAGSQSLVLNVSPPEVPAVSNLGQPKTLSTLSQAPGVTFSRQLPVVDKDKEESGVTLLGLVPPAKVSAKMSASLKAKHYQSCDPTSSIQTIKSSSTFSPNFQQVSASLPIGGTSVSNSGPWQSGTSTDRKLLSSYSSTDGQNRMPNNFYERQSTFTGQNPGGNQELRNNSQILGYSISKQQRYGNNSDYVSQGQAGLEHGNNGPSESKKTKYHMPSVEPSQGFFDRPALFLGGIEGNGNGDDKHLGSIDTNSDMTEFIKNIIEAGKCLQLLNYRVFDTDLNPTASMNVDEIKNLFKMKNVDPRAGNKITSSVNMSMFESKESTWSYMMTNFHHNTYITIRFAKMVPELLNMSKVFDPVTKQYNYFTYTKEEENIMMQHFPMLRVFQEHFLHVGEMVTTFNLTDEEFALLSALLLFPAEISGLENPKAVEDLQNKITAALQYYEEKRSPDGLTRFGILLVRVAELIQCLLQHNLAIGLLLTHNPTIKVPQLFHELIIESIKEGQRS